MHNAKIGAAAVLLAAMLSLTACGSSTGSTTANDSKTENSAAADSSAAAEDKTSSSNDGNEESAAAPVDDGNIYTPKLAEGDNPADTSKKASGLVLFHPGVTHWSDAGDAACESLRGPREQEDHWMIIMNYGSLGRMGKRKSQEDVIEYFNVHQADITCESVLDLAEFGLAKDIERISSDTRESACKINADADGKFMTFETKEEVSLVDGKFLHCTGTASGYAAGDQNDKKQFYFDGYFGYRDKNGSGVLFPAAWIYVAPDTPEDRKIVIEREQQTVSKLYVDEEQDRLFVRYDNLDVGMAGDTDADTEQESTADAVEPQESEADAPA